MQLKYIDTFSLSRTVFEIFYFNVFRVRPWLLTFRGHLRSKLFSPFKSPYMTSYLTSIDILSLSRTVFEIFDFKVFRVWPWPFTFRGHPRSNIFSPFESSYVTSYLTSWPLSFRGHLRSKISPPFESPYMTSHLTSIDSFYLRPFLRYSTS